MFGDNCEGVISWLNGASYYTAFTEGWALYAENPLIAEETDTYDNDPLQLYGMLKWQIWRALRLMMDTGLHYKGSLIQRLDDQSSKIVQVEETIDKQTSPHERAFIAFILIVAFKVSFRWFSSPEPPGPLSRRHLGAGPCAQALVAKRARRLWGRECP